MVLWKKKKGKNFKKVIGELGKVLEEKTKQKTRPEVEIEIKSKKPEVTKEIPKEKPEVKNVPKPKEEIIEEKPAKPILKEIKEAERRKQILEQRKPIKHVVELARHPEKKMKREYIKTGIPGFDGLLEKGIPKGTTLLVAGGTGSGKTIFCLQTLANAARKGEKCLYMTFEESAERLRQHMEDFGWNPKELERKGNLAIQRVNPFDIARSVDALLAKTKGELLIDVEPVIFPKGFKPDIIAVDSLTAIASTFARKEESYRIYIEQLFRFFEKLKATCFLITETKQIPTVFSPTGVEEFLADGVIVLYGIRRGDIRENAIEVLKLRGAKHKKRIVLMKVVSGVGIKVYPEQEVFGLERKE